MYYTLNEISAKYKIEDASDFASFAAATKGDLLVNNPDIYASATGDVWMTADKNVVTIVNAYSSCDVQLPTSDDIVALKAAAIESIAKWVGTINVVGCYDFNEDMRLEEDFVEPVCPSEFLHDADYISEVVHDVKDEILARMKVHQKAIHQNSKI